MKGNVKKIVSGLLSAVMILSAFLQPVAAYAAEPEPAAYEADYPALEKIKEKQERDEEAAVRDSYFKDFMTDREAEVSFSQRPFSDFLLGMPLYGRQVFSCKNSGQVL